MAIRISPRMADRIPVDVSGLWTSSDSEMIETDGQDAARLAKQIVRCGNRPVALSNLFDLEALPAEWVPDGEFFAHRKGRPDLIWTGDCSHVWGIGAGMKRGVVWIDGAGGDFTGAGMADGELLVQGPVGSFAGASMTGGLLAVTGNAADHCAADRAGDRFGMNRGLVVVGGSTGPCAGAGMRRGTLLIAGSAEGGLGHHMRAGTIWVEREVASAAGDLMVRGTIVQNATTPASPAFVQSCRAEPEPTFLKVLDRWASQQLAGVAIERPRLRSEYELYHGDITCGGRGEVWMATE